MTNLSTIITRRGTIDIASLIPGRDTEDPISYLQKIFNSGILEGKVGRISSSRQWIFQTKPTTGLGPQSQYLTLPQKCVLEWEPGAVWDFSAYDNTGSSSPIYLRRQGSYGDQILVSGSLSKGDSSISLATGSGATLTASGVGFGSRLLLRLTTLQTSLVGAWTLVDAYNLGFAARSEDVLVKEIVGDTIYLLNSLQDDYDISAIPVIQTYIDEPEITLINPTAIGPGIGINNNDDRFLQIALGRNIQIIGGKIENFAQSVRIFSSLGGKICDLTMYGIKQVAPGGGLTIGDGTTNFLVDNCTSYGGGQMFMQSASASFYGVTRKLKFRGCKAFFPLNGFTTHNIAEQISWEFCEVDGSRSYSYNMRCPNGFINGCRAKNSALAALDIRISPNGLVIDNFRAENCLSGIVLNDSGNTPYDYSPANIRISNTNLLRIGGVGSAGALAFAYSQLVDGLYPILGSLFLKNISITMVDNSVPVSIRGKWTSPELINIDVLPDTGLTPTTAPVLIGAPTDATTSESPTNPVLINLVHGPSFTSPSLVYNELLQKINILVPSVTTTDLYPLPSGATISSKQSGGRFNNTGASNSSVIILPYASGTGLSYTFYVTEAFEVNIKSIGMNQIKVGTATPVLNLKSSTKGAWVKFQSIATDIWSAELSNVSDWTSDFSPYSLGADLLAWYEGTAPVAVIETDDVISRWNDSLNLIRVSQTTDNLKPIWTGSTLDFTGNKYLENQTQPAFLQTGNTAGSVYATVDQTNLPADTSQRTIVSWGNTTTTTRSIGRTVNTGVNHAYAVIGDGAAKSVINTTVDFSGVCTVSLIYTGTQATVEVDGVASSPLTVTATTASNRFRIGASSASTPILFGNMIIRRILFTNVLGSTPKAQLDAWLAANKNS